MITIISLIGLMYYFYKIAIIYHVENGDTFKAIFDIYFPEVVKKMSIKTNTINKLEAVWSYLQYLRIPCKNCGTHYPVHFKKCRNCKESTLKNLKILCK